MWRWLPGVDQITSIISDTEFVIAAAECAYLDPALCLAFVHGSAKNGRILRVRYADVPGNNNQFQQ